MSSSHPAGQYPNIIGEDMPLSVRIREIIIPMDTRLPGLGAQYIYRIYENLIFYLRHKYGPDVMNAGHSIHFVTRDVRDSGRNKPMIELCIVLWIDNRLEIPIRVTVRDYEDLGERLKDKLDDLVGSLLNFGSGTLHSAVDGQNTQ